MSGETIIYERSGQAATIWFNRPASRNAFTREMSEAFREAVARASADPEVRVILYRGKGDDFCAGSALDDLQVEDLGKMLTSFDPTTHNGFPSIFKGVEPIRNDDIPKLTIAVVHGYAVGGGFEIAVEADLAVVAEDAKIGDFHIRQGLIGGAGVLANLARMIGVRRTKEIVFTGKIVSGAEAAEWGLVNQAVPLTELDGAVARLVGELTRHPAGVTRLAKMAYGRSLDADKDTLAVMERLLLAAVLLSDDAREGVESFLEKREPNWRE
ncbi:MAG: enoyl-CoA hydratase/isomerase family protein [Solirubrobacterales bacterium]